MTDRPPTMAEHIFSKLEGFYAGSDRLTVPICEEIAEWMSNNGYSQPADFNIALSAFRDKDAKSAYCPTAKQLKKYFQQKQTTTSFDRKYRFFVGCVIRDGWYKAIQSNTWATAMLKLMQCDPLIEYSGMENWLVEFCQILHNEGDPAKAFLYASEKAPMDRERFFFLDRFRYLDGKPLEFQQGYFPHFRFQRYANFTGEHLYGRNRKLKIPVVGSNYAPAIPGDDIPF